MSVLPKWLIAVAWIYVALLMALAEGTSPQGSWLGAAITFLMYGVGPLALVTYLLGAPARRKAIRARERAEWEAAQRAHADAAEAPLVNVPADGQTGLIIGLAEFRQPGEARLDRMLTQPFRNDPGQAASAP